MISTIQKKLAAGKVTINPNDPKITNMTHINAALLAGLLKPYAKHNDEIRVAMYPHNDGGRAIIIQSALERDPFTWYAVAPIVELKE